MQNAPATSTPDPPPHDERLHAFVHDLQNCLHVVGLGVEILKTVRSDDARFADVSESILVEYRRAVRLLVDYRDAENAG